MNSILLNKKRKIKDISAVKLNKFSRSLKSKDKQLKVAFIKINYFC